MFLSIYYINGYFPNIQLAIKLLNNFDSTIVIKIDDRLNSSNRKPYQSNITLMNRLANLLEKQLSAPKKYSQLKGNPFPYLLECNRLEIFEFIFEIQAQNQRLRAELSEKYPHLAFEEAMQQSESIQLARKLLDIQNESRRQMEIEIENKIRDVETIRAINEDLQTRSKLLQQQLEEQEIQLIEVQKEKRELEFKHNMHRERQQNVDISQILNNLYKEVKNTLEQN